MKRTMNFKKIITLVTVIALVFSFAASTVSAATASDAKKGVVAIQSADGGFGTGFAIGKEGKAVEYIVTNNHVVDGDVNTTAIVYFNLAANKMVNASVCYYDAKKDIAILRLPEATTERVPLVLCPNEDLYPDDNYFALGYPGTTLDITEWIQFSPNDITVTRGGIKKTDTFEGVGVYYLDLTITYGNSGGPLVNSNGEVVGINRGAVNYENQAIVIDELIKILKSEEIPFSQTGDINWILIIGAAVLVVIIVLVVVLIVRKKGSMGGEMNSYPAAPVAPAAVGMNNATVAGVNSPAQQKPSAKLIAVGGTLNGKRYSLSGAVKIGRDSSRCAIAFPVNTKGVSAVHCEISFNGSVCCISDLNSTYGTFMVDGRKINAGAPQILNSGDKFYLASSENTFEVRF